ncbi:putative acetolactate synthase small subunit [Botrimarina hoheduenensis]|uniref:acetolactate synthase n=2 Tax=Botrimarina hoheduenensis TaxID=2528000 RepID=A0A5C5W9Q2_9BACT|nr:putative acetolactate synthase small subunit [Botrimarina hoheduenensis]
MIDCGALGAGNRISAVPFDLTFSLLPSTLAAFWPMRHVLSALVQNVPGVLAHVSGMLASRAYNIHSLAVGETEDPEFSRMTFVVVGDDGILEQVRKQLEKIVTVVRVDDVSSKDHVERDLMLIKVKADKGDRPEIRELSRIFRGRIVDVSPTEMMIELSGQEKKVQAFIDMMRPFGIIELCRTGRIAMVRSVNRPLTGQPDEVSNAGA